MEVTAVLYKVFFWLEAVLYKVWKWGCDLICPDILLSLFPLLNETLLQNSLREKLRG